MTDNNSTRRRFLQAATATGVVGIAGCIGDDEDIDDDPLDDDDTDVDVDDDADDTDDEPADDPELSLTIGTSTGGTMDVGLAVEAAVSATSDTLDYTTVESPGYIGTARRLDEDQFDGGIVDTATMNHAINGTGEFEETPVDKIPWQGFLAFPYNIYLMAREDTDIETFDDLAGANVYPAEPGFSTRATTLDVWSQEPTQDIYEEMNIIDIDVSDAPGRMEEGEIDAAIAYGTPGIGNTGWVVEYDARTDVRYVEHTDALIESIEQYAGAGLSEFDDAVEDFAWDQDIGTDDIVTWDLNVTYAFHPEADPDAVYELTRVAAEENDTIREAEQRFTPEDENDLLASALADYPFHPGAAEYYQDAGAWDDDWVVGDLDQVGDYN